MTGEQFGGVVRAILAAASGYFVGTGVLDNDTAVSLSAALATVAVAAWSIFAKRKPAA